MEFPEQPATLRYSHSAALRSIWLRKVILAFYYLVVPPAVLLGPSAQGGQEPVEEGPEEATTMIRELGHLSCEMGRRLIGLFNLGKRRIWGDLNTAFQYIKGVCKKDNGKTKTNLKKKKIV